MARPRSTPTRPETPTAPSRNDLGFLLSKAGQRWNEVLAERFTARGFAEVRPAYGSILIPLFEEDGLRMGELARRARLSKQTLTTLVPRLERDGLIERRSDPGDRRAALVFLTTRARAFAPVAAAVLTELDDEVARLVSKRDLATTTLVLRALMDLRRGDPVNLADPHS
jgi:DNA-binding MarR family transcriptional regulator